jgi:hypothetical protein
MEVVGVIKATPIRPVPPGAATQTPSDQPHGLQRLSRALSLSLSIPPSLSRGTAFDWMSPFLFPVPGIFVPGTNGETASPTSLASHVTQPIPFSTVTTQVLLSPSLCLPREPCYLTSSAAGIKARSMIYHTRSDAGEPENAFRQPCVRSFA